MRVRGRVWRGLVLGAAALSLLVLVAAVSIRVYGTVRLRTAERRFVQDIGPLDPSAYAPPRVPAERNAASVLLGGAQAIVLTDREERLVRRAVYEAPPVGWLEEDLAALRTALTRNAAALALLREARAYAESNLRINYRDGTDARLPNLLQALHAARLLTADTAIALLDGDLHRALADAETLSVQARAYTQEPQLIVAIVGMSLERHQLEAATLLASSPLVDAAALGRVKASLQQGDLGAVYRRALVLDNLLQLRTLRDPTRLSLSQHIPPLSRIGLHVLAPLAQAELLDRARACDAAFRGRGTELQRNVKELETMGSLLAGRWTGAMPNILAGAQRALGTESRRRLVAVGLDLRLAAVQTGRYPNALSAAQAEPDPMEGVPLSYRTQSDGTAILEVPGAAETWKKLVARQRISFRLTLPPPPTPASR
jgi:hypothetical protein